MKYYISKKVNSGFEDTIAEVKEALVNEGFGVLTEIPIHEKLKEKLNVDFRKYVILGACNPGYAYEALKEEDKIGTMLPCNVVIQEHKGVIEVSAIDPVASMMAVNNSALVPIANHIRDLLRKVIDNINNSI
jgi:uncharacterized protein (DUF302 family)